MSVVELEGTIQNYAWGSHTAIAEFQGRVPASAPEAELWLGTHPRGLGRLVGGPPRVPHLRALLSSDLSFLFKLLAAERPLSLQAHPSRAQAEAGFEAEERAGIPIDAPSRNYRDRNHKPELICARTEFHALSGFRTFEEALQLLDAFGLRAHLPTLFQHLEGGNFEAGFLSLFEQSTGKLGELIAMVLREARALSDGPFQRAFEVAPFIIELCTSHPNDPGVLAALLLNYVRLLPGEAIFLPAGNLHAYLRGVGFEVMASSDNVMRGGLTPKHVDVKELCRVLEFSPYRPEVLLPDWEERGPSVRERVYRTPAEEFELSRLEVSADGVGVLMGPTLLFVDDGAVRLSSEGSSIELSAGRSAFVDGTVEVTGSGALVVAGTPR